MDEISSILDVLNKNNIIYEKNENDIIIVKNINMNKLKLISNAMYHNDDEFNFATLLDKNNEHYHVSISGGICISLEINNFNIQFCMEFMSNYNFEEMYIMYKYLEENYIFYKNDDESYLLQDGKKYYVLLMYERDLVITSRDYQIMYDIDSIESIIVVMSKNFPDSIKNKDIKIALK